MSTPIALSKPSSKPVAFRLDEECNRILAERAAELGVSSHELARFYVTAAIKQNDGPPAVILGLAGLYEDLRSLREDVLLGIEALLASAGSATAEEAAEWIKENYKDT